MAIQTHLHQENLGLPISSQDYYFLGNNNNNNYVHEFTDNNLQQQQQQLRYQQQLLRQRQQQRQQQIYLQNMQMRRNDNDDSFVFLQPTKEQKLGTTTTNTAATTTTASTTTTTTESDNMSFSQSLFAEVQKQGMEIDRYVTLQGEWLKMALQEQRKQHLGAIIKKLEAKTHQLLKQKDVEIEFATKRALELQQIVQKMEVENQTWQKVATQNEAIVFSLNNTLQQLQQQQQQQQQEDCCVSSSSSSSNDNESMCNVNKGETTTKGEVVCKVCKTRNACVLLLPCRHMCCCRVCEVSVDNCPVCNSQKMANIHALIS